jgi:hypothetical protein
MDQAGIWSGPRDKISCPQSEDRMGLDREKVGCSRVASFKGEEDLSLLEVVQAGESEESERGPNASTK